MGLTTFISDLQNIGQQEYLRPNVGYRFFFDIQKAKVYNYKTDIKLQYILKELPSKKVPKGVLDVEEFLVDIGNIERRFNNLINCEKVSEIGSDKTILHKGDIIIPKMQPQMGNIFLNLAHKRYIGSTELIEYEISKENNPIFIYYLITSTKFLKNLAKLESGKTHRRVNSSDLLRIRIPLISRDVQDQIVARIAPIENRIRELKTGIIPAQQIINEVFAKEFNIDLERVNEIERSKYFPVPSDITFRNNNLRSSVRWNKIAPIQGALYRNNQHVSKLGKYIVSIKNGWSPNCKESDTAYCVFSVSSISKDGYIKFDDLKHSDEGRPNIENFYAQEGDLFVSRGNTVDLVALASVVRNLPDDLKVIFPDLFIKIEVDPDWLDKEYLAHLFNSIIGRFYFKYAAKGKNQTMVKVSAEELNNFYLPVPPLVLQMKIVEQIRMELEKQEKIKQILLNERSNIDKVLETCII